MRNIKFENSRKDDFSSSRISYAFYHITVFGVAAVAVSSNIICMHGKTHICNNKRTFDNND